MDLFGGDVKCWLIVGMGFVDDAALIGEGEGC